MQISSWTLLGKCTCLGSWQQVSLACHDSRFSILQSSKSSHWAADQPVLQAASISSLRHTAHSDVSRIMGGTPTFCSIPVPQSCCNRVLPRLPSNSLHSIRPRRFKKDQKRYIPHGYVQLSVVNSKVSNFKSDGNVLKTARNKTAGNPSFDADLQWILEPSWERKERTCDKMRQHSKVDILHKSPGALQMLLHGFCCEMDNRMKE